MAQLSCACVSQSHSWDTDLAQNNLYMAWLGWLSVSAPWITWWVFFCLFVCFFATPGDVAMIGKAVSGDHSQLATVQCLNPNDKPRLTFFLKTLQKQQNSQFWHQEASSCDVLFLPLLKILYWEMPKESYNVGWMGRLCFSDVSMYHCRVFLFSEDCLVSGKNKKLILTVTLPPKHSEWCLFFYLMS